MKIFKTFEFLRCIKFNKHYVNLLFYLFFPLVQNNSTRRIQKRF